MVVTGNIAIGRVVPTGAVIVAWIRMVLTLQPSETGQVTVQITSVDGLTANGGTLAAFVMHETKIIIEVSQLTLPVFVMHESAVMRRHRYQGKFKRI